MSFDDFSTTCPGCKKDTIQEIEDRDIPFLGCTECFGLFTDEKNIARYVSSAAGKLEVGEAFEDLLGKALDGNPPTPGKRTCPQCQQPLGRMGFGESPFVILDRCAHHGLWLDKKELTKVIRSSRAHARVLGLVDEFDDYADDDED